MSLLQGFHRHHVVPRYMGGTNAPENLVTLHPIDHAIAHLVRFKLYGNPADGWAYNRVINGLSGELIPNRKGVARPYMRKAKSEETRARMSAASKGKKKSPEAVEKVRVALTRRKATPEQLGLLRSFRHLAWGAEAQRKKSVKTKGVPRPYAKNSKPPTREACIAGGIASKGRKQTTEQVSKRVASRRATLAAQGRAV